MSDASHGSRALTAVECCSQYWVPAGKNPDPVWFGVPTVFLKYYTDLIHDDI